VVTHFGYGSRYAYAVGDSLITRVSFSHLSPECSPALQPDVGTCTRRSVGSRTAWQRNCKGSPGSKCKGNNAEGCEVPAAALLQGAGSRQLRQGCKDAFWIMNHFFLFCIKIQWSRIKNKELRPCLVFFSLSHKFRRIACLNTN